LLPGAGKIGEWIMLPVLAAAIIVTVADERPEALLGADGRDGYAAALAQKLETPGAQSEITAQIPGCTALTYTARDFRELTDQDTGSMAQFYQKSAQKPSVIEHVQVAGCGQTMQLNLAVFRPIANPALTIAIRLPGDTQTGMILQKDAYLYADIAARQARTAAGETEPCTQIAMIYNTKIVVPFQGNAPYKEVWYASKCGFNARLAMTFTPTPDGGTDISAHVMKPNE
jgi:hypothetical protein